MDTVKNIIVSCELNLIFRILVATLCGAVIGYERRSRAKEAGIRTHCIVAMASAMMMIISKYAFGDLIDGALFVNADVRLDPSRMAQGIVTGVGFLGSGLIFHQRGSTQGLTTAAGIWATSGIGMALGAGMYVIGITSTAIMMIIQYVFHALNRYIKTHKAKLLRIYGVSEIGYEKKMVQILSEKGISVSDVSLSKNSEDKIDYTFSVEIEEGMSEEEIVRGIDYPCSLKYVK